jgi:alpha-beta hydrolase superfamily lysophospholipase
LAGNGVGATTAALFVQDNPTEADGLLLNSPLLSLSPSLPAFKKPWFSSFDSDAGNVSEAYHRSLHVRHHGSFDWNLVWKPIVGFPVYAGWIDAVGEAGRRMERPDFILEVPTLVLTSTKHVPSEIFIPALYAADALQSVEDVWARAAGWGTKVQVGKIEGAVHDVFLSDEKPREEAFDAFFDFFLWATEAPPGEEEEGEYEEGTGEYEEGDV